MSIDLYDAAIPTFDRMMRSMTVILDKTEAWAKETGVKAETLAEARLTPDMFALPRQVQIATDTAKGAAARLAGIEIPRYEDTETTLPQLKERLAKTIAFVNSVTPGQINGNEGRTIELTLFKQTRTFTARDYVFQFALPNFMFHVVTAYGIIRAQGAPIGKIDFLAGADAAA